MPSSSNAVLGIPGLPGSFRVNGPWSDFIPRREVASVIPTTQRESLLLPLVDQPAAPEERSDAARNRARLLDTAAQLVAEHGPCALTMDELARRAGVGKGTVFRRFGSRAGLMRALLDHSERELQAAFLSGPPPLGPGAGPVDRLVAFGRACLEVTLIEGDLQAAAQPGRYTHVVYSTHVAHVAMLLRQAGAPGDPRLMAESLLATIEAPLVLHQMRDLNAPLPRIAQSWETLVRALLPPE
ncbi:MAG: TetR/AcrR family transcriptional regulator [Mycobacteriaceae bacterium]|nr:TetR/AcrR family transcriptional regulator [Mycobacteriaceae bacterium]